MNKINNDSFLRVDNVTVYGMNESMIASGYPMSTDTTLEQSMDTMLKRAKHLGKAKPGSGHDCFLKGITVQFDLTAPEYFWRQLDRYHFIDYVSSQSKMHRILKLDLDKQCNPLVLASNIDALEGLIKAYNEWEDRKHDIFHLRDGRTIPASKEILFQTIVANIPAGLRLTARMTTNYLQLKTIREQRKNHKLLEWHILCDWLDTLPLFKELTAPKPKPYATCNQCGSAMVWQSDFDFEDYGLDGEGIVSVAVCSSHRCNTYAEYRTPTTAPLAEIRANQGK